MNSYRTNRTNRQTDTQTDRRDHTQYTLHAAFRGGRHFLAPLLVSLPLIIRAVELTR